jgi:glycosyltransferase involved in cell wall biosynthesis
MSPAPSIVLVNDHCYVQGGAARIAIDEAVGLAHRGLDVTFIGATGPVGPELAACAARTICLEQPELADVANHPSVAFQGLWNVAAYRRTRQVLARLDPANTVLHVHGFTKSLTTSPVRAAVRAGFPVLVTLHDFFSSCPNGNLYDYRRELPCTLTPMSAACVLTNCDKRSYAHKVYRVVRGAMQRWPGLMPGGVRDFVGLSNRSVELLSPHLPVGRRVHRLENIIDVEQQPPVEIGAGGNVVFVGRLDPEKGVELLLDASRRAGTPVVFVGDGPLRKLVEADGRHRVTGWQTGPQVHAELSRA